MPNTSIANTMIQGATASTSVGTANQLVVAASANSKAYSVDPGADYCLAGGLTYDPAGAEAEN